jgi:DNA-binding NtrC family response regulator
MRLLIIGTLDGHIGAASRIALDRGAKVLQADGVDQGLALIRDGRGADLVLIDVTLDVPTFIGRLASERISVPVVACGIGNDTRAAVNAIRAGAKEYLPLPPDAELIGAVLAAVCEDRHVVVCSDPRTVALFAMADRFAPSDASVLITGTSGTGKEVLARHVHARSRRADKRFVAVNCAAIPETLLESELFGHEKGAFTGAIARRIGRFEEANGGTLLLDEISEMDIRLQAKLLRAIQERVIDRIGGSAPVKIDVRILATSNRNLEDCVEAGTFREDLYFRLNVVTLHLPSLKERPRDILPLAEHFTRCFAEANGRGSLTLSEEARRLLQDFDWPGNVRELENTIHRAVLLTEGDRIEAEAIVLGGRRASSASVLADGDRSRVGCTVAEVERDLIIDTVRHCLGNRTHAATILGISIRTLRNKLRQYMAEGVAVPMPGDGERQVA